MSLFWRSIILASVALVVAVCMAWMEEGGAAIVAIGFGWIAISVAVLDHDRDLR